MQIIALLNAAAVVVPVILIIRYGVILKIQKIEFIVEQLNKRIEKLERHNKPLL